MTRFTLTGRAVQGDPMKAGPQRKDKSGVLKFRKDGAPDAPFFYAIAIPKDPSKRFVIPGNPSYEEEKAKVDAAARAAWPNMFNPQYQRPQGLNFEASLPMDCSNPKFANKIQDGDGYDENGKPNNVKDGWAGCWVVKVSNGFAPKVYEWQNGWAELTPHSERKIKLGDYVTVSGTCESNQSTESPGMYMNFDTVSFEQEGELIVAATSVDPNQALGARGGNPPASGGAGAAHAGGTGGAAHGTGGSGTASGGSADQPYSGYREDAAPPPPSDDAPPPPSGPEMTAKAGGKSYESFIKAGWNDEQLRKHGYIA